MIDEEGHAQAAEYALGTLPPAERAAFEQAMAADPELRAALREWEERLAGLADRVAPVTPPASVWRAIERRIGAPDPLRLLRRSRARWRATAAAAMALVAGLVLFIATGRPGTTYLAVVNRGGELPALVVAVDTRAGLVTVRSVGAERPAGRSLELWVIAASGGAPRSLGLVDQPRRQIVLPEAARGDLAGATVAVSVEPPGGSPSGTPTGPVIYSGKLIQE